MANPVQHLQPELWPRLRLEWVGEGYRLLQVTQRHGDDTTTTLWFTENEARELRDFVGPERAA